jgi:hypothetical protein
LWLFSYPRNGRVQHFDDSVVNGHLTPVIKCTGDTTATVHASRGADCGPDGAATDAGARAAISIANPIATLRQIETSSNATVLLMTFIVNLRLGPGTSVPAAFTS